MSVVYFFICLQFLLQPSFAVPVTSSTVTANTKNFPNPSPPNFVGFVSDPNGRGTISLLVSCLLTLVLCVWSALHLNVPRQASSKIDTCLCNLRWVLAGIYAPELVVFTAWRQWTSAKLLGNLVEKLYTVGEKRMGDTSDSASELAKATPSFNREYKWTKAHDFFACTGGFAFEIESGMFHTKVPEFLPSHCPSRLTLTARGIALLAECGHLPDVPEGVILDKSKANDLAKAMVLVQASWMLLQTIGRLIARLPVTLLEVNTVVHVGCVFFMYVLWWNKPLLPNEPIILKGDWVEPLCAYMYMSSEMSGTLLEKRKSQTWVKTAFASLNWFSRIPEVDHICLSMPQSDRDRRASDDSESQPDSQPAAIQLAPDSCLSELQARRLEKAANTAFFERRPRVGGAKAHLTAQSAITQRRWELMQSTIDLYPAIHEHFALYVHQRADQNRSQHQRQCIHFTPAQLLVENVQNWPSDDLLRNVSGLLVGIVLWLLNLLYGGIHAAAWNSHFPTTAEKWLWRTSASYIGFCGGLWIVLNFSALTYSPLNEFWESWMDGISSWFYFAVLGSAVVVCGLSFCVARGFILIEAFISIRSLEQAAYDTPDWAQLFPHF